MGFGAFEELLSFEIPKSDFKRLCSVCRFWRIEIGSMRIREHCGRIAPYDSSPVLRRHPQKFYIE